MRVVVVGAGVLGASVAFELAARGADVALVDAVGPGSGTSSRGGGLVAAGGWHPTSIALVNRSLEMLRRMSDEAEAANRPFRLHETGSTTLLPEGLAGAGRDLLKLQRAHGVEAREVAPEKVPDLPRHAGMDVAGVALGVHYPRDGWARPRLYAELRANALREMGGRHRVLRASARLLVEDGRVAARADGEALEADAVVLAAGIHARALLREAGLDAPLLAYRTQAAKVAHARASDVPILHDAVEGFYLRPGQAGHLLAGDGTTTTPEDPLAWKAEADEAFVRASVARVRRRFPFLADCAPMHAWAGLDAATPDRLLLAGPHPGARGLWLCAGGNGHGFMRAPAVGESLAALLLGDRPAVDIAAYDPARFADDLSRPFAIREGYALHEPEA